MGSVGAGQVSLAPNASGFALGYGGVSNFQDIQLSQKALVDASGADGSGGLHLSGRQVRFLDGSVGLIQNLGSSQGGNINVNASELVEFAGTTADGRFRSNLTAETSSDKPSGAIQISTRDLIFREGGQIVTRTFAEGNSGPIAINASESVQVLGISSVNPRFQSSIFANSGGTATGNSGDLSITTKRFIATGGSIVSNASFSNGMGGNFTLNAELVDISGRDAVFNAPTDLRAGSFRVGDGGYLTLNAQRLFVRDGGRINVSTIGSGDAGRLDINASQFVDVNGGTITASGGAPDFRSVVINGFNATPSGQAGTVKIKTPLLAVRNEGRVIAQNIGTGDAGRLQIDAGSVVLDRNGILAATAQVGEGGTIEIAAQTGVLLRRDSLISVEAGGPANAGNIAIAAPVIAGFGNSDIVATAFEGRGGAIALSTLGLFGLKVRDRRTPANDIIATSQLGINGTVQINNLFGNPSSRLVELLTQNNFLNQQNSGSTVAPNPEQTGGAIVEATGWRINPNGNVELIATQER